MLTTYDPVLTRSVSRRNMYESYVLPTQFMYGSIDSILVLNYWCYNGDCVCMCVWMCVCVCVCVCVLCSLSCYLNEINVSFVLRRVKHAKWIKVKCSVTYWHSYQNNGISCSKFWEFELLIILSSLMQYIIQTSSWTWSLCPIANNNSSNNNNNNNNIFFNVLTNSIPSI